MIVVVAVRTLSKERKRFGKDVYVKRMVFDVMRDVGGVVTRDRLLPSRFGGVFSRKGRSTFWHSAIILFLYIRSTLGGKPIPLQATPGSVRYGHLEKTCSNGRLLICLAEMLFVL